MTEFRGEISAHKLIDRPFHKHKHDSRNMEVKVYLKPNCNSFVLQVGGLGHGNVAAPVVILIEFSRSNGVA